MLPWVPRDSEARSAKRQVGRSSRPARKTDKGWAGTCRRLTLQFADEAGTTRMAEFRFIK